MSTVLVVEDSVTQREMIEDLLKGSGLTVKTAGDGVDTWLYVNNYTHIYILILYSIF